MLLPSNVDTPLLQLIGRNLRGTKSPVGGDVSECLYALTEVVI